MDELEILYKILFAEIILDLEWRDPNDKKLSKDDPRYRYLHRWLASKPDSRLKLYPTKREKIAMSAESGLTVTQINNWLSNIRRRGIKIRGVRIRPSQTHGF